MADEPYVVVIGGANVDIEGRCSTPPLPNESNPGAVAISAGGVARNIAANLASTGLQTHLVTALGEDDHGQLIYERTAKSGVDLSSVLWTSQHPTATYLSIVDANGEPLMAVNDMAITAVVDRKAIAARTELLRHARVVVVDCNVGDEALDEITSLSPTVFVDTTSVAKAPRIRPYLDRVHTLKPNRAEATALTGIDIHNTETARRAAQWLLDAGVATVYVTLGPDGVVWADQEGGGFLSAPQVHALSTTGAGDAFTAALVKGFCNLTSPDELVELATEQAAAITTEITPGPQ
ncbi:MAG: carbohydrate kinase family protein [bacterium]|nr:carbohydrate kinase family protein [bacterium]MCY3890014.1 carbohydrate kinase family protein [bacterium]